MPRGYHTVVIALYSWLLSDFGAHDFCGEVFGTQGIAIFHAFGLNFIAWLVGVTFLQVRYCFERPCSPPQVSLWVCSSPLPRPWFPPRILYLMHLWTLPQHIFWVCLHSWRFEILAPSHKHYSNKLVKEWSKDQKKLEYMKHAKAVVSSPLTIRPGFFLTETVYRPMGAAL